jgi:hypothetical protein
MYNVTVENTHLHAKSQFQKMSGYLHDNDQCDLDRRETRKSPRHPTRSDDYTRRRSQGLNIRKRPNIYITTSVMLTGDKQDRAHSILSGLMILL